MMKTIAYLTDTHLNETGPGEHGADAHKNWELALSDLDLRVFDRVIFGGDIGEYSAYPEFFKALADYDLMVTPGNHDTSAHVRQFFGERFHHSQSGFYHSEEDDDVLWLFLDSSTDKISQEQLDWVQSVLAQSDKAVLLFIHHPILAVDSYVDRKYPLDPESRQILKNLLLDYGKPVTIFCGHCHVEDATTENNIRQFVTPAVSYQIKKGTPEIEGDSTYLGYRLIYIDGANIDSEVIVLSPDDF